MKSLRIDTQRNLTISVNQRFRRLSELTLMKGLHRMKSLRIDTQRNQTISENQRFRRLRRTGIPPKEAGALDSRLQRAGMTKGLDVWE